MAISGYSRDEDRLRSQQAGFDVHLTKPVDFEVLRQFLCRPERYEPGQTGARFIGAPEGLLDN